jgi:hypothetical protein
MKKMIILIFLTAFLLMGISVYSQELSQPATKGQPWIINAENNTKSKIKSNSNSNIPQKLMSEINKNDTNDSNATAQDSDKKNGNNQIIVIKEDSPYTLLLTIFTFLLVVCNVGLWLYTKKTANAAKKSAEALPAIERAYVFVEVEYGSKNPKPHDVDYFANALYGQFRDFDFQVILNNHGKTPAIMSHVSYSIIKADRVPKTKSDLIGNEYRFFEPCIIIESGGVYCKEIHHELTEEETKQIWSKNEMMLCLVQIAYVDIFSIQHTSTFCCRYDIDKKNFVIADTPLNIWA